MRGLDVSPRGRYRDEPCPRDRDVPARSERPRFAKEHLEELERRGFDDLLGPLADDPLRGRTTITREEYHRRNGC